MKNKAFIFIELLFVLFLLAIIASVAIPAYPDYMIRSQVIEGFSLSLTVKKTVSDYYAYHGKLPENNLAAGLAAPEQLTGNYVVRTEINNGQIFVTFGNKSSTEIQGKILSFTPEIKAETMRWNCNKDGKITVENKYLPGVCKSL